jgi:hypothetical protein
VNGCPSIVHPLQQTANEELAHRLEHFRGLVEVQNNTLPLLETLYVSNNVAVAGRADLLDLVRLLEAQIVESMSDCRVVFAM